MSGIIHEVDDAVATDHYWARPAGQLLAALGSDPEGLSVREAAARLRRCGPNVGASGSADTVLAVFLRQYRSPLVLILVFGAAVAAIVHDWLDALIILAIVLGSTLLSFSQEFRASRAVERLRSRLLLQVRVRREGQVLALPVTDVVPGEVVLLAAGDMVPADGVVLEANDLMVAEAALTGEPFPVEKQPGVVAAAAPLPARSNCLFQGTSVRSGTATMLVLQTGRATRFGAIGRKLEQRAPETDFQRGLRRFGLLLTRLMAFMTLLVLAGNLLLGRPLVDSLLFAVALAVGLSPELLPVIVTVTLSAGARRMASRGVLVRRLDAIDNLGSMTVLCTDKTGTLTEGRVRMEQACDTEGAVSKAVLRLAVLNAALQTGLENPLDQALVAAGAAAGIDGIEASKVAEIPYDFVRRRLSVVVRQANGCDLLITKGALAAVLEACTRVQRPGGTVALDAGCRTAIEARCQAWSTSGMRVLGLAIRVGPARAAWGRDDEHDMEFAGFLLFADPPKTDAPSIVRDLARMGVAVKLVSGDNRYTAAHVAEAVGLRPAAVLTGTDIDQLTASALLNLAPRTDLFAEMDPNQKERVIRALQAAGAVVGYMGDGINDAPSLHVADVGISVDQAVDVARESADLVLLGRDLDVLRAGIAEGRRTIANTLKYIRITTSANFGNMISMAGASLVLPFLPLLAKQILLNNFLSDFPSLAIAGDRVDTELTQRPSRWDMDEVRRFMVMFGLVSSAFDVLTFLMLFQVFGAGEGLFRTGWFVESLLTELAIVLIVRSRRPFFRSPPSPLLLWRVALVAGVALLLPYFPPLARPFGLQAIPAPLLAALLGITALYVLANEAAKAWYYRARSPAAG